MVWRLALRIQTALAVGLSLIALLTALYIIERSGNSNEDNRIPTNSHFMVYNSWSIWNRLDWSWPFNRHSVWSLAIPHLFEFEVPREEDATEQVENSNPLPTTIPTPEVISVSREAGWFITFYNCDGQGGGYCNLMANGEKVYSGVAACGGALRQGSKFKIAGDPTSRVYECTDTGYGGWYWVDIWFPSYQEGIEWLREID